MEKSYTEFTPKTTRIEAFSDAVFAIVMTILVLDLKIPNISSQVTDAQMANQLLEVLPNFLCFGLSFLILAIFWVNHHQFFHTLRVTDRALLWYNNNLLFWLCCIPFPTAFIGEGYLRILPVTAYGFVLFMSSFSFNLLARHAHKKGLIEESIPDTYMKVALRRGMAGPLMYFASMVFAPVSVYISLGIFVIGPVFYFIPQKIIFGES